MAFHCGHEQLGSPTPRLAWGIGLAGRVDVWLRPLKPPLLPRVWGVGGSQTWRGRQLAALRTQHTEGPVQQTRE